MAPSKVCRLFDGWLRGGTCRELICWWGTGEAKVVGEGGIVAKEEAGSEDLWCRCWCGEGRGRLLPEYVRV